MASILHLSKERAHEVQQMAGKARINRNQCINLVFNLVQTIDAIENMYAKTQESVDLLFRDLYRITSKAMALVVDCTKEDWCHSAVFQWDNKEAFRELIFELEGCFDTMCDIFSGVVSPQCDQDNLDLLNKTSLFHSATQIEIEEDQKSLVASLQGIVYCKDKMCAQQDQQLAMYLLERINCQQDAEGCELNAATFPRNMCIPDIKPIPLGKGSYGMVVLSNWFGLESATKLVPEADEGDDLAEETFRKEVGILAGMSHPNIIKFMCCGRFEDNGRKSRFVVMELMKENLTSFLERQNESLPHLVAIDIMMQIASAMCYLHDNHVAHRDLKPQNILVTLKGAPKVSETQYVNVKVVDFGDSKIEAQNNSQVPTRANMGTAWFRAPEVFSSVDCLRKIHAFKTDVYAFGFTCAQILSRESAFSTECKVRERVKNGERPSLHTESLDLALLIRECWDEIPGNRPYFSDICKRLKTLKSDYFKHLVVDSHPATLRMDIGLPTRFLTSLKNIICSMVIFIIFRKYGMITHPNHVEEKDSLEPSNSCVGLDRMIHVVEDKLRKTPTLGFVGMAGIGKTTSAKAVFHHLKHMFEASCFIEDLKAQKDHLQILKDILKSLGESNEVHDLDHGQNLLRKTFDLNNVLIVLDDICNEAQINDLVNFGPFHVNRSSKLILTSRNWQALKGHVMEVGRVDVPRLDQNEAMKVFLAHAFPTEDLCPVAFEQLSEKIVTACNGLPLSLKCTGDFLCGKVRLRIWERALKRLLRGRSLKGGDELNDEIWKRLRSSFDELPEDEKGVFLDLCCFFCSRDAYCHDMPDSSKTLERWHYGGNILEDVVRKLRDKSLLEINQQGLLKVQYQYQDMGRRIVDKEYTRTRLHNMRMSTLVDMIQKVKCSKSVEVLELKVSKEDSKFVPEIEMASFPQLRLLHFNGFHDFDLICALTKDSSQLKCLEMWFSKDENYRGFQQVLLDALWCQFNEIQVLKIGYCASLEVPSGELWTRITLIHLAFIGCKHWTYLPEALGNLTSLCTLDLSNCENLMSLPYGVGLLIHLKVLILSGCKSLAKLPQEIGDFCSLTTFILSGCSSLSNLPGTLGNLDNLKSLILQNCKKLLTLPESIGNLISLQDLNLNGCASLMYLPRGVFTLSNLTTLDLTGCVQLSMTLNMDFDTEPYFMKDLKWLKMKHLRCEFLPDVWDSMTSLLQLDLKQCMHLTQLPESMGDLSSLIELNLSQCSSLTKLPESLGNLTSLKMLSLYNCESLISLPESLGNLTSLTTLSLYNCKRLRNLPESTFNLCSLETLDLSGCFIEDLLMQMGGLISLTTLDLSMSSASHIPKEVGMLRSLNHLNLEGCKSLEELPVELGDLTSLELLNLRECVKLATLPEGFGNLRSLNLLNLEECRNLVALPDAICSLAFLKELNLSGCLNIMELPVEFGNLTSMEILDLSMCTSLTRLPESVSNLSSLRVLDLNNCTGLRVLPQTLLNLKTVSIICPWNETTQCHPNEA